jgi:hypothetical protein
MERLCAGFDLRAAADRAGGIARPRTSDHVAIRRATSGCPAHRIDAGKLPRNRIGLRCAGRHDPVSAFARPYGLAQAHGNCPSTAASRVDALATRGGSDSASRENYPVDCRSDIDKEGGDRPVTRRSRDDGADHCQIDQHTRGDTFDVNGHCDPLCQPDPLEARTHFRMELGAGGVAKVQVL